MEDAEVRQKLKTGWIRGVLTFEVAGKPISHVEESLQTYVDALKKDERIVLLEEHQDETMEHDDGMFSAIVELEILGQNLEVFTWIAINFSPASIEILEPAQLTLKAQDVMNWINDLLSKVHEISHNFRDMKMTSKHLLVAMNQLVQNAVLLSLSKGKRTEEQLINDTGVTSAELKKFLDKMVEKGTIVEVDGVYSRS